MSEGVWDITLKISSTSMSGIGILYRYSTTFTVRILSNHPSIL